MKPKDHCMMPAPFFSQTVKETRTVLGGGCAEMLMSCSIEEAARGTDGKKVIAVEAFERALRESLLFSLTMQAMTFLIWWQNYGDKQMLV
jgi:hypothetical protein